MSPTCAPPFRNPETEVITGAQATEEARQASGSSLAFVNMFLMTFAIVALVVGSFVIYNTFSITVAQRTKETALLRAIGAKRRQVMRSVRLEALFTGVFASMVGVVLGIGLAQGLQSVLTAFGIDLPSGGTVLEPRTIVVSMLTGVIVTFVAAWLPARRAAKVAPIEALRDTALDTSTHSKRRVVFGVMIGALGAVFIAQGLSGAGVSAVGFGALGVFLGVAMLGPVIARRFSRIVGWPLPRMRGMAGTLAPAERDAEPASYGGHVVGVDDRCRAGRLHHRLRRVGQGVDVDVGRQGDEERLDRDDAVRHGWVEPVRDPAHRRRCPRPAPVTALRYFDAKVDGRQTTAASAIDPTRVEQSVALALRAGKYRQSG